MAQQEDILAQIALARGQVTALQLFDAFQEMARHGGQATLLQVLQAQRALTPSDVASLKSMGGFKQMMLEESTRRRMVDVFTALLTHKARTVGHDELRTALHHLPRGVEATLADVLVGMGLATPETAQSMGGLQAMNLVTCESCRWVLRSREQEPAPQNCPRCKAPVTRWHALPLKPYTPPGVTPAVPAAQAQAAEPQANPLEATLPDIPAEDQHAAPTILDAEMWPAAQAPAAAPGRASFQDSATMADFDASGPATPAAPPPGGAGFQDSATMAEFDASGPAVAPPPPGDAGFQDSATLAEFAVPTTQDATAPQGAAGFQDSATMAEFVMPKVKPFQPFVPPPAPSAGEGGFQDSATMAEFVPPTVTPAGRMPPGVTPPPAPTAPPPDGAEPTVCDLDAPDIGELRRSATPGASPQDTEATLAGQTPAPGTVSRSGGAATVPPVSARSGGAATGKDADAVSRAGSRSALENTRPGAVKLPPAPGTSTPPARSVGISSPPPVKSTAGSVPALTKVSGASAVAPSALTGVGRKPGRGTVHTITPEVLSQIKAEGKIFGDYYLLDKLGQGGMGAVYKAYDTKFNRFVAIKLLTTTGQGGEEDPMVGRFWLEARAAAKFRHPNIVPVYDIGTMDKTHYMVMHYCEGRSLDKEIKSAEPLVFPKGEKPLDGRNPGLEIKTVLRVLRDLCLAVDVAHQNKIVHRDLKPANIMVAPDGMVQLTDFGLALDMADTNVRLTKSGITLGTPLYMSPEQGAGDKSQVDSRTDIYALGAITYELVTGRPPFEGNDTMSVLVKHMHLEPTPPSKLVKKLDPQLEEVILKCLEKEKRRRYETAGELAEDFDCLLRGEPIRTAAPSMMHRFRRWNRRNRQVVMWASVAAAAVAIASYFGYTSIQIEEDRIRQEREAEVQKRLAHASELLGEAENRVSQAESARKQGKTKSVAGVAAEVETLAKKALLEDAKRVEAHLLCARAHRVEGGYEAALKSLEPLFAAQPDHAGGRFVAGVLHLDHWADDMIAARAEKLSLARLLLGKPFSAEEIAGLLAPGGPEAARQGLAEIRQHAARELGRVPASAKDATSEIARALALLLADPAAKAQEAADLLAQSAQKQDKIDEAWLGLALAHQWRGDEYAALDAYESLSRVDPGRLGVARDRILLAVLAALRPGSGEGTVARALKAAILDLKRLETLDPGAIGLFALRPWVLYRYTLTGSASPTEAQETLNEANRFLRELDGKPGAPAGPERHFLEAKIWSQLARAEVELQVEPVASLENAIAAYGKGLQAGRSVEFLEARAETWIRLADELRRRTLDARAPLRSALEDYTAILKDGAGSDADTLRLRRRRGSAWITLAEVLTTKKEEPLEAFEEAAKDMGAVLEKDPADALAARVRLRAHSGMAGRYGLTGKGDLKMEYARRNEKEAQAALQGAPEDAELWQILGAAEATIATHETTPREDRTLFYGRAEEHYQKAVKLGFTTAWNDLAMLYLAVGNDSRALDALRSFQASLPKPNPELQLVIQRLEQDQSTVLKKDLDDAKELAMKGEYEAAEEKYVVGLRKLKVVLQVSSEKEAMAALQRYSGDLARSSYDLACIYAQASVGKAGNKPRTKKPTPEEAKTYVDKAFEQLGEAFKFGYGQKVVAEDRVVRDKRLVDAAKADKDLEPLWADARWKGVLERLDKPPAE